MTNITKDDERFDEAVKLVLSQEGGYVNDSKDRGGETKYGISKRSYPDLDIASLTKEEAKAIYHRDFWEKPHYNKIQDLTLAIKIFDIAVNIGVHRTNCLLQRALRTRGQKITEDGVLGPLSLTAVNALNPAILIDALKSESAEYYRTLVANNQDESKFLKGWLNRAYS